LPLDDDDDVGLVYRGDVSLRLSSIERFSGEGERRARYDTLVGGEGRGLLGSGDVWRVWRQDE